MVDIIIRAKDGHEFTGKCIESIRRNTPSPDYRIILVDDGSTEQMDWPVDLLVRCGKSSGAVTATNLGLALAMQNLGSPYVAVFDNDTEVPEGDTDWLSRFVKELEADANVACVGATTSLANAPQHILHAPRTYTADWKDAEGRAGVKANPDAPWFVSFACLLRKVAIAQVGFWDERYNPGNYEDTDYALQLRTAGWKVRVAQSVYIHHHGHKTFSTSLKQLLQVNGEKFQQKWGLGRLLDLGMIDPKQLKAAL